MNAESIPMSDFAASIERPVIPRADGFSTAMERLLASGGGMRVSGFDRTAGAVFSKGRLRGKTIEEAVVEGRRLWASAPDSVKERYARYAKTGVLAPSERPMAATIQRPEQVVRPMPGNREANGRQFRAELGIPEPVNPSATPGAGRGTSIVGITRPESAPAAAGKQNVGTASSAPNPGVATPIEKAWTGAPAQRSPEMKAALTKPAQYSGETMTGSAELPGRMTPAPSRSQVLTKPPVSVAPGKPEKKINPLTGRPMGWHPSDETAAVPKVAGYVGPSRPALTKQDYDSDLKAIRETIEPGTPEMTAALDRRRKYEDQEMTEKAAVMRRQRLGPSFAERDAADRKARRALDRRVEAGYGMEA